MELCKDIRDSCHIDVRAVFARAADSLDHELEFIRKSEIRINKNHSDDIKRLNSIQATKK